jgi:hypothetical protein
MQVLNLITSKNKTVPLMVLMVVYDSLLQTLTLKSAQPEYTRSLSKASVCISSVLPMYSLDKTPDDTFHRLIVVSLDPEYK